MGRPAGTYTAFARSPCSADLTCRRVSAGPLRHHREGRDINGEQA
jgi:hypothetical protein